MKKIKAVIFDWGGVLVKNVMPEIFKYVAKELKVTTDELIPVYEKYQHEFLINAISEKDFWKLVSDELKINTPHSDSLFADAFNKFYEGESNMLGLVKAIQAQEILTGLLSDAEKAAAKLYFEKEHALFDAVVFSSVVGVEKPDREIYELILAELGVEPEEALYFDDREENIIGAKKLGIKAYLFKDLEQVKKVLEEYGVKTK